MHNGQFVLANGYASPAAAAVPKVKDVYEGRRIVKYEEDSDLIDLY
jgi:hypothetical protein